MNARPIPRRQANGIFKCYFYKARSTAAQAVLFCCGPGRGRAVGLIQKMCGKRQKRLKKGAKSGKESLFLLNATSIISVYAVGRVIAAEYGTNARS